MTIKRDPIKDGRWWYIARKGTHTCCDCGLTHNVEYGKDREGRLRSKWTRNERSTAAYRRRHHPKDKTV